MTRPSTALPALMLVLVAPLVSADTAERDLRPHEVAELREVLLTQPFPAPGRDLIGTILAALAERQAEPATLERVEHQLRHDLDRRREVLDVLRLRTGWRGREAEVFHFWWDPSQVTAEGLPSRPPTEREVAELEGLARSTALMLGMRTPHRAPYRIDLEGVDHRAYPPGDLRWGITTRQVVDREAVVLLLLAGLDVPPYLARPFAVLLGTCAGDPACRERVVQRARRTAATVGHVPVLDGLAAGGLGTDLDPAHASGVLLLDLVEREAGREEVVSLLRASRTGLAPEEWRRLLLRELGVSPRRLDRALRRDLLAWTHGTSRD